MHLRQHRGDRALWRAVFLFPNPTDGHWMRAIFGDSEPRPTDANRQTFETAVLTVRPDRR